MHLTLQHIKCVMPEIMIMSAQYIHNYLILRYNPTKEGDKVSNIYVYIWLLSASCLIFFAGNSCVPSLISNYKQMITRTTLEFYRSTFLEICNF